MVAFGAGDPRGGGRRRARRRARACSPLFGVGLAAWLIAGALSELAYRIRLGSASPGDSLRRLAGLPRSAFGTTVAHAGVGMTVLGIVAAITWSTENILTMRPGDTITIAGRDDHARRLRSSARGRTISETVVQFTVREGGAVETTAEPAKRQFAGRGRRDDRGGDQDVLVLAALYVARRHRR